MHNKFKLMQRLRLPPLCAAFLLTLATSASAAPGDLSEVPLFTTGSAEPNIMFVMDSSGSMNELVLPPDGYDGAATYASCSNPLSNTYISGYDRWGRPIRENVEVEFRVRKTDGRVEFDIGDGTWRIWNSSNNCFANNTNYTTWLYAAGGGSGDYYTTGSSSNYNRKNGISGHLLNWYFSQQSAGGGYQAAVFTDSAGKGRRSKVDIRRTDIMKTAASELVAELEDVRVGLMQFDDDPDDDGGKALFGLTSMTEASRAELLGIIDGISASTWTPLAETFEDVGRYFITGYETEALSYINENGNTATAAGNEIFASQPDWGAVATPGRGINSAIQYYCQKSFMVALTDGEPTQDSSVSDVLDDYDYACNTNSGGCTTGNDESMDDVIKALYDIDLRPDLKKPNGNEVINNITSYIIGFAEGGLTETNLMKNAGALGGGGVYGASNAAELKSTFNRIIKEVDKALGSGSSLAFTSSQLDAGVALFAAKFNSPEWSGDLSAIKINEDGSIASSPSWSAAGLLDSRSPDTRVMLSFREGTGGVLFNNAGVNVDDSANQSDLNFNTTTNASDDRASERIDYLRGDRSKEGANAGDFRERTSRLGDIVNSSPIYVAAPNASWLDTAPFPVGDDAYSIWRESKKGRTPMVYVGANDGFLHGFNAATEGAGAGEEVMAYSPAAVLSEERYEGLHALTSQDYLHRYYVDGTPSASDVYIDSAWKTVLVGGLGGGGKGYFALDVTDPGSFSASSVLWEFTDADSENLGLTFSRPQIAPLRVGEDIKWAAIFGNGYNSETGDAGIFIVYLDGADENGKLAGTSWKYISTNTASEIDKNGMSTPAIVDSDRDGVVDRIYAGDLKGNMWVFDVSSAEPASWGRAYGAAPLLKTGEPITAAPLVVRNTANKSGTPPNLLVTFGTGQYLTKLDISDTNGQGFYAVLDDGVKSGMTPIGNLKPRSIGIKKVEQVAEAGGGTKDFRILTGDPIDWTADHGWYVKLKGGGGIIGGERVVARPDLRRNVLFFNTFIPTGQVCSSGGFGLLMSMDFRTGLAPTDFAVFDANGDGEIGGADEGLVGEEISEGLPNQSGFVGKKQYTSDSSGTLHEREYNPGGGDRGGRLSWEELVPY